MALHAEPDQAQPQGKRNRSTRLVYGRALAGAALAAGLAAAGSALSSVAGCASNSVELCGEIPSGGCPLGRGGSCDDAACLGLYDCVNGLWTIAKRCPTGTGGGGHGGAAGSGGGAANGGSGGEGGCTGATLDHSGEVQGCTPDLELPDCPADVAESCHPCLTGCEDFYMCEQAGWAAVAYCTDQGQLVVSR